MVVGQKYEYLSFEDYLEVLRGCAGGSSGGGYLFKLKLRWCVPSNPL